MSTKPARTVCAPACWINPSAGAGLRRAPTTERVHQPASALPNPGAVWAAVSQRRFFEPGTHGKPSPSPNGVFPTRHSHDKPSTSPNGVFPTGYSWPAVTVMPRCFRNIPHPHGKLRSAPLTVCPAVHRMGFVKISRNREICYGLPIQWTISWPTVQRRATEAVKINRSTTRGYEDQSVGHCWPVGN